MASFSSFLFLLLVLLHLVDEVKCCGGFMCFPQQPILQSGENIAFGISSNEDGSRQVTMVVQINYEGPAQDFAWVLPIMFEPQVSVGSDVLFDELFDQTRPTFELNIANLEDTPGCEDIETRICPVAMMEMSASGGGGGSTVTVLQEESVGPYDFVLLEPAEVDPGISVFTWLDDNGYDQPIEAFSLIDYYARQDQLFLALRLRKNVDTGDIQPIVLEYTLPAEMVNVACVPIQLTSIAATPDMPIQLYVLSEGNLQAFPVNYFSVELDDTRADWLGCQNSPNCYLNDMRDRLATFLEEEGINGHAFVTEYAGTSSIIEEDSIALDINLTALESTETVQDFMNYMSRNGVPGNDLINTILGRYVSAEYTDNVISACDNTNVYQPEFGLICHEYFAQETISNISALVQELNETVFAPTIEAQEFVNRFSYLTRFYGQLSPENMDKDPFFSFNSLLPDVSHIHEARAVPMCSSNGIDGLDMTVGDTNFFQPAENLCSGWRSQGDAEFPEDSLGTLQSVSMATRLTAAGYEGEEGMEVLRSSQTGFFPPDIVADIVTFMDARAPNQTVPPYNGTFLTGTQHNITTMTDSESEQDENSSDPADSETENDPPPPTEDEDVTEDNTTATDTAPVEETSRALGKFSIPTMSSALVAVLVFYLH